MRPISRFFTKLTLRMLLWAAVVAAALGVGLAIYAATLLPGLPTIEDIRRVPLNIPLRIFSRDNQLLAEYGNERRIPLTVDAAPQLLIDAILATEDDRFYRHSGVDFIGIARAGINNILSGSRTQGASTITMQVARNFFLTPERTYKRKLKEILLAFNMERALTKDEILELYLNKIFLGHRAYGFAAAAQVYYGRQLEELSVPQIAMLAGLPKAPSRDNPISNPDRAVARRAHVLKRMLVLGKIDGLSYRVATESPITAARQLTGPENQAPYVAEMARQIMADRFGPQVYENGYSVTVTVDSQYQVKADAALRKGLLDYDRRHGFRGPIAKLNLAELSQDEIDTELLQYPKSRELIPAVVLVSENQQLTAYTQDQQTIEINWPHIEWAKPYISPNQLGDPPTRSDEVVSPGDVIYVAQIDSNWHLSQLPEVSGAVVSIDPSSGAIIALSGGFDYYLSKFNRATQALRQPGSNIKPFIYSAALENGFTPASLISAMPIVVEDELEGVWIPQNFGNKFFGPTRLRAALSRSLNLVSVRLARTIGLDKTIAHLEKFGFASDNMPRFLSLALGSLQLTPLDMAAGFAVFANGGYHNTPYLIERIVDGDGNEIELNPIWCESCGPDNLPDINLIDSGIQSNNLNLESESDAENVESAERAISAQNAFLMTSMLREVILSGTGRRALVLNRTDLAGKTGTTNDFRDAWFSGFNSDIVTTVFVGFDEPSHLGRRESGAVAALPIWIDFMATALKDFPEKELIPPPDITVRFINKTTGELTYRDDVDGYFEYFPSGAEPDNPIARPSDNQTDSDTNSDNLF